MLKRTIKFGLRKIMPGNFPDFMIIGAQKSGTSSLHSYLRQHPNLTASSPKEIHYFDKLVHHGYSMDWYKNKFKRKKFKTIKPQLYYESTPKYIYVEDVAKQIAEIKPNTKFILVLREPTERAYSAWNMYYDIFTKNEVYRIKKERFPKVENPTYKYLYKNRKVFPSFTEAIKMEEKLMKENISDSPSIIRRGFYAKQIKSYLKYFNRNQFLILGFKELINNSSACLDKVYNYLGIETQDIKKIDLIAKNKRKYLRKMTEEEENYVNAIYQKPNEELFNLLGFRPEW